MMQSHLSRNRRWPKKAIMATPALISADGSSTARPFVEHDLFRTLVENVTDTIFLIDLDSEECIGKIGIPDSVLLKRRQLTPREMRTLEMHTTLGEHLLSRFPFLSNLAHDVVAYHHEHWDGSGYPWGLSESEIPLVARIFAVADAFDSLTHDRPYRAASSAFEAIDEIEHCAGTYFDPVIVEAFLPIARRLAEKTKCIHSYT
jgi:hypothetical protein